MKDKKKEKLIWIRKTAIVLFLFFFVWTLIAGDIVSDERKNIMLAFLGLAIVLLLVGVIKNEE